MNTLWLIKFGEIALKKGNAYFFNRLLQENIKRRFSQIGVATRLKIRSGRYYLETDCREPIVRTILGRTPGIVSYCRAERVNKNLEDLRNASIKVASESLAAGIGNCFKFEIRRVDKSLPLDSYGYARELGHRLLEALPELRVNVKNPDFIIRVELREQGYVYQRQHPGVGGIPAGSTGRGMLLLSGGIDSPVAGALMAKRGLRMNAVHFHTPPFTSSEAHDKAVKLASLTAPWCGGLTLISVPFSECQIRIKESVNDAAIVLHSRICMMQIAQQVAEKRHCGALITGEALGQVASQTLESLSITDAMTQLPVFRPLIGMDKEEIIAHARRIGTFETSIMPFDDCCVLFSSQRPLTRPLLSEQIAVYESIEGLDGLMDKALSESAIIRFNAHGQKLGTR